MKCYLLIHYKVREYTNWQAEFDSQLEWRKNLGERSCQIFTDHEDINKVTLLSEWNSFEEAKKFLSDPLLSEIMQIGGVLEQPYIQILAKEQNV